jgi:hypothetical protein
MRKTKVNRETWVQSQKVLDLCASTVFECDSNRKHYTTTPLTLSIRNHTTACICCWQIRLLVIAATWSAALPRRDSHCYSGKNWRNGKMPMAVRVRGGEPKFRSAGLDVIGHRQNPFPVSLTRIVPSRPAVGRHASHQSNYNHSKTR